jgi:Secretion system C-terminal sorting domain
MYIEGSLEDKVLIADNYIFYNNYISATGPYIYDITTKTTDYISKIDDKYLTGSTLPLALSKNKIAFLASTSFPCYCISLYLSDDLGKTFKKKDLPGIRKGYDLVEFIKDSANHLILLTDNNVYISYDEGDTWNTIKGNLPSNIEYSSIAISNDQYLYVGMKGAPIYKTKLPLSKTIKTDDAISEISDFRLSPNPVTDELNIQFADNQLDMSSISIYSIEGKLLQQAQFYGNNTSLDVQYFPAGMYILQLNNGDKSAVKRFVKQ